MTITSVEADDALRSIARAEQRGAVLRGYRRAAPHLMLWGVLWFVGYGASFVRPGASGWIWVGLVVLGTAGNVVVSRRGGRRGAGWWRGGARIAAIFVFVMVSLLVLRPADPVAVGAFVPLILALVYVLLGLDGAPRLGVTGAVLAALTLVGWFGLHGLFLLWMGSVGAVALFLGGVWLRRA